MGVVLLVSVTVRCRMLSRIVADSWWVGPTLVAPELLPDLAKARIRGLRNDEIVQDCALE